MVEKLWFSWEPNSEACKLLRSMTMAFPGPKFLYVQESNTFLIVEKNKTERLMSYNITSQEIQHLGKSIRGPLSFDTYVESLVLHKGFKGKNLK